MWPLPLPFVCMPAQVLRCKSEAKRKTLVVSNLSGFTSGPQL